jgi:hypothetical protein
LIFHSILVRASAPEWEISETEADTLNRHYENVIRHYPVGGAVKTIDWLNLIGSISLIYGTRLVAVRNRRKHEAEAEAIRTGRPGEGAGIHMVQ